MDNAMTEKRDECFVIMPISDPEGYEKGHFQHVYDNIVSVACESADFKPVRADDVLQTNLIHLDVLKRIIETPMAVCDLSNRNPNVLFELGLRQAFDKPVVLIQEKGTPAIFDIAPLRYTEYRKELVYHEVLEDQKSIADAMKATKKATDDGGGLNSMVKLLSLTSPAQLREFRQDESSPMMQMLLAEMGALRREFKQTRMIPEPGREKAHGRGSKFEALNSSLRHAGAVYDFAEGNEGRLNQVIQICSASETEIDLMVADPEDWSKRELGELEQLGRAFLRQRTEAMLSLDGTVVDAES